MITHTDIPSSSSSPPPIPRWTYDVFLSFRGEDTRKTFTDHLYTSLKQKGIITFRDDEGLERGKAISPKLLKAIEESRFVIAIFSSKYADSRWCLDELAKAVDCMNMLGQTILPVFYHVDPSEVRKQTGKFGQDLCMHQERFKDKIEQVNRWRAALTQVANLSGWHLQDGSYESKVIQEIVGHIFNKLNETISSGSMDLVGIDSRIKQIISYLDLELNEVCMIGISGMGGIGKTTIAQVVYERIRAQFEAYSFLANVRETTEKQGLVHLQKQLLSDILLESNVNIQNIDMGVNIISQRLRTKMVLIILDDVNDLQQLKALCGHSWFGSGSRIIITSRDEQLLRTYGVESIYKVKALNDGEALQLFSWKAFRKDKVGEDFLELSKSVLEYANGLPLAIEVLGSLLFGKSVKVWTSALDRLKVNPDKRIIDVLKVTFDALEDTEKEVFLDIACFFKGEDRDRVTRILESSCGYSPDIDIEVLIDKSMVTLFGRQLWMHDLIQELGWEIVRRECRDEPCKRSRLWLPKDIIPLLEHNKGTSAVESILLNLPKQKEVHLNVDPFSKMCKLRLLKINNARFSGDIKWLSNELQVLEWHVCPLYSLPSNFQSDKLVELSMHSSCIKQLWKGNKRLSMLKFIDMSDSQYLIRTPSFVEVPNIETLVLEGCTRLVEVDPSIGVLKRLNLLNMRNCKSLKSLPPNISLESLTIFNLSGCSSLKKFPEIEGNMQSLLELHLDGTAIEELPASIESLTGLTLLNLGDCTNLFRLPSTIHLLTSLKSLILTGCSELGDIPENLNCVECLEDLDISGTAIRELSCIADMKNLKSLCFRGGKNLPPKSWHSLFNCWGMFGRKDVPVGLLLPASLSGLSSLTYLNFSECNLMDGDIPNDLGSLVSLRKLILSGNKFSCLPESISQLSKLQTLYLNNCSRLQSLPKKLPLSVRAVHADDCTSLMDYPDQFLVWTSSVSGMTTMSSLISSKHKKYSTSSPRQISYHSRTWIQSTVLGRGFFSFSHQQERKPVDDLSMPNQVLQKDLEVLDYKSCPLSSGCEENEIPEWFSNIDTGSSIRISIPAGLKDDEQWMGVSAVFLIKGHPHFSDIESESETPNYFYKCTVVTQECQVEPVLLEWNHLNCIRYSSHFLCLFYVPCRFFPKRLNESSVMWAVFETNNPCMEVQKCGIHLLFEQGVAGFIQTFMPPILGIGGRMHDHDPLLAINASRIVPSDDCINLTEVDKATIDSGWFNLVVDHTLRWEKLLPTYEEGSKLPRIRNMESFLSRYLEGLNHKAQPYDFLVSGSPAWFKTEVGSTVSIQLPPHESLHKSKKWMGFALCTSLVVDKHTAKKDYVGSCRFQWGRSHAIGFNLTLDFRPFMIADAHQLLVFYLPRAVIPQLFIEASSREIFTSYETGSPGVKVQICGLRILYKQDLQGFVQTITHCILRSSGAPFEVYNKLVVEDWLSLVRLPSHKFNASRDCDSSTRHKRQFELISQSYRNMDWSVENLACTFPGVEIPEWFINVDKSDSAKMQLNGNWMGIAVCASLSIHEHPNIIFDNPYAESTRHDIFCYLKGNIASAGSLRYEFDKDKEMWMHPCNFICFVYIPRAYFPDSWNQCDTIEASIESDSSGFGVHKCALGLVFEEDVEDLVQMLTYCHLSAHCRQCEEAQYRSQKRFAPRKSH
ncbi:disease resistance protein RUN1 [Rosa sericea]